MGGTAIGRSLASAVVAAVLTGCVSTTPGTAVLPSHPPGTADGVTIAKFLGLHCPRLFPLDSDPMVAACGSTGVYALTVEGVTDGGQHTFADAFKTCALYAPWFYVMANSGKTLYDNVDVEGLIKKWGGNVDGGTC